MSEYSRQTVVDQLFDHVLPLVPELADRLEEGIDVLDAGCGAGLALIALARRFPASRFTGSDLCADALAIGRKSAAGLDNIRFEVCDLTAFDEPDGFDFITSFDAIHDQKDPQGLVHGIYRSLRPGGIYLVQDIGGSAHLENNLDFPFAAFLYTASCLHCTPVSLGQGGEGLGTRRAGKRPRRLEGSGLRHPEAQPVSRHDPMNVGSSTEGGLSRQVGIAGAGCPARNAASLNFTGDSTVGNANKEVGPATSAPAGRQSVARRRCLFEKIDISTISVHFCDRAIV